MVMINTTISEMNALLRKKLSRKDFEDLCFRYGIDVEGDGEYLNFEVTSDRVEIISKFSLAYLFGQLIGVNVRRTEGLRTEKADILVKATHRPFVNILHVKLSEPIGDKLGELLLMQDKFDNTVGRNRFSAAIGMFDYSKIKFPITYEKAGVETVSFVPLGLSSKKTYSEIITDVEKGKEYGWLLKQSPIVWRQKGGEIFALPPIINSDFASVNKNTRSILVDITGNSKDAVNSLTKALIFNLQFIGEVSFIKPTYEKKTIDPALDFKQNRFFLDTSNIRNLLGVEMSLKEASKILNAMGYEVQPDKKEGIIVTVPFYREDVIHQVDIIDDILRYYGVQNIKPNLSKSYTPGSRLENFHTIENIIGVLVGSGYQELDLNVLTNETFQFRNTGIESPAFAPLVNQKSGEVTMARANVSGEMLRFISNNLHKKFPHKLFDVGFVLAKGDEDVVFSNKLRLCVCYCGQDSNLSEIRVLLDKVFSDAIGEEKIDIKSDDKIDGFANTFIKGRAGLLYYGENKVGVIGEIHPRVLNEFKIELPVSMAEVYLDALGL
jgi:phenylalanyl-tRNA synthetase beta chain